MPARDLTLRHLAALHAIAEHGSYRRAANALGYSQTAITQQIASLERALGVSVFERPGGPRPVTLTEAGREVLAYADATLFGADRLQNRIRDLHASAQSRLSIGTFQSVSAHLLPDILATMRELEPTTAISVHESDENPELIAAVLSGDTDVTFLVGPVHDERLIIERVCTDPFVAVLPRDSRDSSPFELASLQGQALVGHDGCVCHQTVEHALHELGITPDFVYRSNDNASVQAMVRARVGIAVMPLLSMNPDDPGVQLLPTTPSLPQREILVAIPRDRPSEEARRFVQLASDIGSRMPHLTHASDEARVARPRLTHTGAQR